MPFRLYFGHQKDIMNGWLQLSTNWFILIKIFFVSFACLFLWRVKTNKLAHLLVFLILLLYIYVLIIHCNIAWKVFFSYL